MTTEETELQFIRCPGCRSLVPAVAQRCRMCGYLLAKDSEQEQAESALERLNRKPRVRQKTMSVSGEDVEDLKRSLHEQHAAGAFAQDDDTESDVEAGYSEDEPAEEQAEEPAEEPVAQFGAPAAARPEVIGGRSAFRLGGFSREAAEPEPAPRAPTPPQRQEPAARSTDAAFWRRDHEEPEAEEPKAKSPWLEEAAKEDHEQFELETSEAELEEDEGDDDEGDVIEHEHGSASQPLPGEAPRKRKRRRKKKKGGASEAGAQAGAAAQGHQMPHHAGQQAAHQAQPRPQPAPEPLQQNREQARRETGLQFGRQAEPERRQEEPRRPVQPLQPVEPPLKVEEPPTLRAVEAVEPLGEVQSAAVPPVVESPPVQPEPAPVPPVVESRPARPAPAPVTKPIEEPRIAEPRREELKERSMSHSAPTVADTVSAPQRPQPVFAAAQVDLSAPLTGWFVHFSSGPGGVSQELRSGRYFVSGQKLKNSDLVISDPSVSTPHCIISTSPEAGLRVQDLMSESGTFVRRAGETEYQQYSDAVEIHHGDWLRIGSYEVMVCLLPKGGR